MKKDRKGKTRTPTRSALDLMAAVAERTMRFDFTVWFWGDSIAFDGMMDAAEITGNYKFRDIMDRYLQRWVQEGTIVWNDMLCPALALLRLYEQNQQEPYLNMAIKLAEHLHNAVPRSYSPAGPLYLPADPRYRNFIWVDSLYHLPSFFCYLAKVTGEEKYCDWGMYVLTSHIECLQDKDTLLFPQSRVLSTGLQRGYGWGRGIGWALLGFIDMYELLPSDSSHRNYVKDQFVKLSEVILRYQDSTGCWRNLIHLRESPIEASTAAFFGAAYEKGVRLELLDGRYAAAAERAWHYVCEHIDAEGGFYNVSACSWSSDSPGDDTDRYMRFYTEVNVWGQGSALRIIGERILAGKGET